MASLGLSVDHVGLAVFDLEAARVSFDRMGFTLAPRSMHAGAMTPGDPVEPWGSGNHCAMFRQGYFEVLGLVDADLPSNVKKMLAQYEGMHIVAVRCESADAAFAQMEKAGVAAAAPMPLERNATFGVANDQTRLARFRNIYVDQAVNPEARFIVIEHVTPDVLWQEHLLEHENGAVALDEVVFATPDVQSTLPRFEQMYGQPTKHGDIHQFTLDHGSFWIASEQALRKLMPAALSEAPLHRVAVAGIKVKSLDALKALFESRGVHYSIGPTLGTAQEAVWVGPADASHGILQFTQSV